MIKYLDTEDFLNAEEIKNYSFEDRLEFTGMYLQNCNSLEQNIKDFKKWMRNK